MFGHGWCLVRSWEFATWNAPWNGDRFKYSFMCILISFLGLIQVEILY